MDLSFWNNVNLGVEKQETAKQFYGRFLWRLVIRADGGRLIETPGSIAVALAHKKSLRATNWWGNHRGINYEAVDISLLENIREIKSTYGNKIRIRIEDPQIQFYTEDEATLIEIAKQLVPSTCIEKVCGPADAAQEQLLRNGVIIRKLETDYKYKVVLKDGRYSITIKEQILNYLNNLGDEVKVSKGSKKMLDSKYSHIWGVFFYTNDPSLVTFITLIEPTIVAKIHELVQVSK